MSCYPPLSPRELEAERRKLLERLKHRLVIHVARPAGVQAAWALQHDRMVTLSTDERGILLVSVRPPSRWEEERRT